MLLVYGLAGAAVYGGLHWFATRVVYQGSTSLPDPATAGGGRLENVWLRTRDGVKINGWLARAEGSRFVTLFLHGNAGNIGHRVPRMREIVAAGSDVLAIDYRGYGHSQGRPTERGLSMDADAAYDYVAALGKPIVLHGESLGSAVAVELATRRPAAGLILEAPFTSLGDVAAHILPLLGPVLLWGFNSESRIERVHTPLLVIHGDRDHTVPYPLGRRLYAAAPGPKDFWTVTGADHNNILETAGAEYRERLRRFYASLAAPGTPPAGL
jgi:fermentation-respiration switch protein FrsA (DUF1100 family)